MAERARSTDMQRAMKKRRDRFQQGQEATEKQRQREIEALSFYAGNHWPEDIKQARQGQQAVGGLPAVPARPCLVFDTLREPIRQVINSIREKDLGIELVAADDFGGHVGTLAENEIELREGLIRRIQRASEAEDARLWAVQRAIQCGTGAYRVNTRFCPGKTFDQEIFIERIYNGAAVTWDPAHEQPDGSDAEWVFIGTDMTYDAYVAEFGELPLDGKKNQIAGMDKDEFVALGEQMPGWFRIEGADETQIVRVVEYLYLERQVRTLVQLADGSSVYKDELSHAVNPKDVLDERPVVEKRWCWEKLDGYQILDTTDWLGPDMPVIKVLNEELQPFNNDRIVDGMVQPAMSSARGLDYMVSKWVETVGLSPIPPWLVAAGQIDEYRQWWDQANNRTFPFLPYKTRDNEGNTVGPPVRTPVEAQILDLAQSVQLFRELQKSTTGVPAVTLGEADPAIRTKGGLKMLLDQADKSTSHALDHLRRSMRYEGQVINNLLYAIYNNRPGRMVSIVNGMGESETIQINTPDGQALAEQAKSYQLTKDARFNVAIKVSTNYDTRRQQEADIVGQILSQEPALMSVYGDIFFKNLDGPGHQELAERAKLMLDPRVQKALADQEAGGGQIPPEVQAIIDGLSTQLDQATQFIQTKQAEQQAKIQTEQIAAEKDIELQRMKSATEIAVAKINALAKGIMVDGQAQNEATAQAMQLSHDAQQAELDREAQALDAERAHEAAAAEGDAARAHERDTTAAAQQHESIEKAKDREAAEKAAATQETA